MKQDNRNGVCRTRPVRLLLVLVTIIACVQAAEAGVNVYNVWITPNTEIVGNQTMVEVVALMDISSEELYTFSPDNTLKFWTDLQDPVWTPLLSVDGNLMDLPVRHSQTMTLTSWDISYPSGSQVSLKVSVKGIAPAVASTQDKTMVRIAEATAHAIIRDTELVRTRKVTYVQGARPPEDPYVPKGSVQVNSEPEHAAVSLDGEYRGETPYLLEGVVAGPHTLTLSLPGYDDVVMTVSVIERQTLEMVASLHPAPDEKAGDMGFVTVRSEPPGAEVLVGGTSYGTTPVYNREAEAGIHTIGVSLPGYQAFNSEIQVIPGQGNTVMVQLKPVQGESEGVLEDAPVEKTACVLVRSSPYGAVISVDGRYMGMTPMEICELDPGSHEILLSFPLYREYVEDIDLEPGETREIDVALVFGDISLPGIDLILGLFSGIGLPGLSGGEEKPSPADAGDRQKAYEELVKQLDEGD